MVNNCPSYREPSWSKPKSYPWLMSFNMMAQKNKSYASLFSGLSSTSGRKKPFLKTPLFRPSSFDFGLETFFLVQSFSRRTCCFGFSGKLRFPLWSNYLESSVAKYPGEAFVRKSARKLRHVVRNEKLFSEQFWTFWSKTKSFLVLDSATVVQELSQSLEFFLIFG